MQTFDNVIKYFYNNLLNIFIFTYLLNIYGQYFYNSLLELLFSQEYTINVTNIIYIKKYLLIIKYMYALIHNHYYKLIVNRTCLTFLSPVIILILFKLLK